MVVSFFFFLYLTFFYVLKEVGGEVFWSVEVGFGFGLVEVGGEFGSRIWF